MAGSMIKLAIALALVWPMIVAVKLASQALDPPDRIAKSWMQVLMFDPTPMGATIFDKDWSKCPTK